MNLAKRGITKFREVNKAYKKEFGVGTSGTMVKWAKEYVGVGRIYSKRKSTSTSTRSKSYRLNGGFRDRDIFQTEAIPLVRKAVAEEWDISDVHHHLKELPSAYGITRKYTKKLMSRIKHDNVKVVNKSGANGGNGKVVFNSVIAVDRTFIKELTQKFDELHQMLKVFMD